LLCLAVRHLVALRVGVFRRPQTRRGRLRAVWTVGVTVGFPRTATDRPRRRRALGLTRAAGPACLPCARPARVIFPGRRRRERRREVRLTGAAGRSGSLPIAFSAEFDVQRAQVLPAEIV